MSGVSTSRAIRRPTSQSTALHKRGGDKPLPGILVDYRPSRAALRRVKAAAAPPAPIITLPPTARRAKQPASHKFPFVLTGSLLLAVLATALAVLTVSLGRARKPAASPAVAGKNAAQPAVTAARVSEKPAPTGTDRPEKGQAPAAAPAPSADDEGVKLVAETPEQLVMERPTTPLPPLRPDEFEPPAELAAAPPPPLLGVTEPQYTRAMQRVFKSEKGLLEMGKMVQDHRALQRVASNDSSKIAWQPNLQAALRTAADKQKPVFVFMFVNKDGIKNVTEHCGGSEFFRMIWLSDPEIVTRLNRDFVPVQLNLTDEGFSPAVTGLKPAQDTYASFSFCKQAYGGGDVITPDGKVSIGTTGNTVLEGFTCFRQGPAKLVKYLDDCRDRFRKLQTLAEAAPAAEQVAELRRLRSAPLRAFQEEQDQFRKALLTVDKLPQ
jgi:hypothetical protein